MKRYTALFVDPRMADLEGFMSLRGVFAGLMLGALLAHLTKLGAIAIADEYGEVSCILILCGMVYLAFCVTHIDVPRQRD